MSVGVHVLTRLVAQAAAALADWDVEIVETHHRAKVDAPSGTALRLAEAVQGARASGDAARARPRGQAGRARVRARLACTRCAAATSSAITSVHLLGGGERLELTHRATSRDVFAHGALRAARWIAGRPPARYTLGDVLGTLRLATVGET